MVEQIKQILIVGGGTTGWMTAAALSHMLTGTGMSIRLIESEAIGTVGVGEATIPPIKMFNDMLGIDEMEFVKATQATFKLGIEFIDWARLGHSYIHPFGDFGIDFDAIPFYQYWIRQSLEGHTKGRDLFYYSLMVRACRQNKFMLPLLDRPKSALSDINYAYQFDAGLYAAFLRRYAEAKDVERIEGKVVHVEQNNETGFVESVKTEDGRTLKADFFIDCSGFRGLLIEGTLKTGYEDWSQWLPANRAVAIGCEKVADPIPYTKATACEAGWQWRIPLQNRTGNGHVYCNEFMSDERAADILIANLDALAMDDPKFLRFTTGRRKKFWNKNVLALGLAAGFMEPLESTSIHLVQASLARLITHFPNKNFDLHDIEAFNTRTVLEYERVRDFLVLHYTATERNDTEFWRHCQAIEKPEHLVDKIHRFQATGRIFDAHLDLFSTPSWLAVMYGQGIELEGFNPVTQKATNQEIAKVIDRIDSSITAALDYMPDHQAFIDEHCRAI